MKANKTKIIIAGSRDYNDYSKVKTEVDKFILEENLTDIEIVSGAARGADALGERYAAENKYDLCRFPANWNKYGKSAGPRRNSDMAEYADACIVFWDGKSRGTASMINLARTHKLNLRVVLTANSAD